MAGIFTSFRGLTALRVLMTVNNCRIEVVEDYDPSTFNQIVCSMIKVKSKMPQMTKSKILKPFLK
jgi:hypothetical protein